MTIDRRRFMTICGGSMAGVLLSPSILPPCSKACTEKAPMGKDRVMLFMFNNKHRYVCAFDLLGDPTIVEEHPSDLQSFIACHGVFPYPFMDKNAKESKNFMDEEAFQWNEQRFFEVLSAPLAKCAMAIILIGKAEFLDLGVFAKLHRIVRDAGAMTVVMASEPTGQYTEADRQAVKKSLTEIRSLADITLLVPADRPRLINPNRRSDKYGIVPHPDYYLTAINSLSAMLLESNPVVGCPNDLLEILGRHCFVVFDNAMAQKGESMESVVQSAVRRLEVRGYYPQTLKNVLMGINIDSYMSLDEIVSIAKIVRDNISQTANITWTTLAPQLAFTRRRIMLFVT